VIDSPLKRLLAASAVAAFYSFGVNAEVLAESTLANLTIRFGVAIFFVWWVEADSRRTGYWPFYHYGFWVYVAGIVLVPHYLLRTRGRAGIAGAADPAVTARVRGRCLGVGGLRGCQRSPEGRMG
jgi:hypothetical protein